MDNMIKTISLNQYSKSNVISLIIIILQTTDEYTEPAELSNNKSTQIVLFKLRSWYFLSYVGSFLLESGRRFDFQCPNQKKIKLKCSFYVPHSSNPNP